VSLTDITTRISIVAGLAMLALLVIGWRKPAKVRGRTPLRAGERHQAHPGAVGETPDIQERVARKTLNALGLGGISIVVGVLIAIVLSVTVSWAVTNFVSRL